MALLNYGQELMFDIGKASLSPLKCLQPLQHSRKVFFD